MLALAIPPIDPVMFSIGPIDIRWYAMAYLAGFLVCWRYCMWLAGRNQFGPPAYRYDEFLTWAVIGTILGGRLGYCLFYHMDYFTDRPAEIFQIWHGGMSFHGGMLGVIAATYIFTRIKGVSFFGFSDILASAVPIGLGFGRVANFINGELIGRPTDLPWGIVFPHGGDLPRHPSQLYEALLEGIVLFLMMAFLALRPDIRIRRGMLSGFFLFAYACLRFGIEFLREPDSQVGFLFSGATMGQLLCIPMAVAGLFLMVRATVKRVA